MDEHAQFRIAVRDVLTILLDGSLDDTQRVERATDMLLRVIVPMPEPPERLVPDLASDTTLYVAGPDGMPTDTIYIPEPGETSLTKEEALLTLQMLHGGAYNGA